MSFAAEMKDFLDASRSMAGTRAINEERLTSRYKRGVRDDPLGPGVTPGTGGGVGETTAPAADTGRTGGQQPLAAMPNRGGEPFLNYAYKYYRGKGLGHVQSSAIAGNLQMESGGDPQVFAGVRTGDGGRSKYAGQWNDQRLANIEAFARERGHDKPSMQDQFDFVLEEGNPQSKYVDKPWAAQMAAFNAAKTPEEATRIFMNGFERPNPNEKINGIAKRIGWASSLQDTGGTTSTAGGIPEPGEETAPAAPAPAASADDTGEEDTGGGGTVIDVPEAQPQEDVAAPQVSSEEFDEYGYPRPGYQDGGAIPDDGFSGGGYDGSALQFADGGNINPDRDYTQDISAPAITMTPRINTTPTTTVKPVVKPVVKPKVVAPKVDPNVWGPGGTSPLAIVPARSGYSLGAGSGAAFNTLNNQTGSSPGSYLSDYGGGGNQNQTNPGSGISRATNMAWAKANTQGMNSLTPQEKNILIRAGLMRPYAAAGQNVLGATPAPARPPARFARGGKVANRDTRFQELLKQESRRADTQHGGGDNARDRAARRLSAEEGRPSSTAYRPSREASPAPAPRAAPRTGGAKPVPIPTPRPAERTGAAPSVHPPEAQTVRATPVRGFTKAGPAGPVGGDSTFRERTLAERQLGPRQPPLGLDLPENLNEVPPDDNNLPYLPSFARGGAIPDDDEPRRESIADRNRRERLGYSPPAKRKDKTSKPAATKTSQARKPKSTTKPQNRNQKKRRPSTGGLPQNAPRPSQRPTDTLPSEAPLPGTRPIDRTGGLPPTAPLPGVRPGGAPPSKPNPFNAALSGLSPAGVMSPIPGVAAPVAAGADVPRGGTWAPPGGPPPRMPPPGGAGVPGLTAPVNTGLAAPQPFRPAITQGAQPPPPPNARPAGMQPNTGAQPATPGTTAPPGGKGLMDPLASGPTEGQGSLAPDLSNISVQDLLDKLSGLSARDMAYPFPTRDAVGAQQYARGGAIPDEGGPDPNSVAGEAGYGASSADQAPVAGQRGYNERVAEGQTVDFNDAARKAAPAVKTGLDGLSRIFGFDATGQQGAVPTPEGSAQQDAGLRRFASGEGAATREEVGAIDKVFGIDRVQADVGVKNLMRLDATVNYYLERGDKEKAEAVAASLLQFGATQVRNYGTMAASAFDDFQKTGDPNSLRHASEAIQRAHQMVPDGLNLKIDIDPKTRQIVATTVDANGKSQKQVVDPQAIPSLLKTAMDGSEYWGATFQIGQPRLAEQELQNTGASQRSADTRDYNRQYDEYKFQRGENAKLEGEERAAERESFRHERLLDEGQSVGERQAHQDEQFYGDWNDRFEAATDPQEKRQLFEEGLQYRFENTPNRKEPVTSDMFGFDPQTSQYIDKFTPEDTNAIRNIARVVAAKNGALDGGGAMEMTAALVMAPRVENNPDGTLNVDGNSLVFNPQLLPQLDTLRKKYRQQGG